MAAQRKYPEELRDRTVKLVLEVREREGSGRGEIARKIPTLAARLIP